MKAQNMSIDINKLHTEHLEQLRAMFFELGDMEAVGQVQDRIAFIEGMMSEKMEKEYINKYCI
jgi:hypothetical protein